MINNRSLVLNPSVVKTCNTHKGPISIPSPIANVVQVTNLFILDSLLYIVVVVSKFFNEFLYRVSLRYGILGCSASWNRGEACTYFFISKKIESLHDFVLINESPKRRLRLSNNSYKIIVFLNKFGFFSFNSTSASFEPVVYVVHLEFRCIRIRFKFGMIQQESFCCSISF